MNLNTYALAQVARFCIEEAAHYGGISSMLCIACVLRNRVVAGWGYWPDVVQDAPNKRGNPALEQLPDLHTANVRTFLQKVEEIYSGRDEEDLVNGALFYTDINRPQLPWFKENILDRQDEHRRVAQAMPLVFFL